jgi:hypothetical protein
MQDNEMISFFENLDIKELSESCVIGPARPSKNTTLINIEYLTYSRGKKVKNVEDLCVQMSGSAFIQSLNEGAEANDREHIAKLSLIALIRKDPHWQAAARYADNYIIFARQGCVGLRDMCQAAFLQTALLICK